MSRSLPTTLAAQAHRAEGQCFEGQTLNNNNKFNSIQFFIYVSAELNSQWPITGSARIQTTAIRQLKAKQTKTKTKWIS
jgi:hypothetical protein